MSLQRPKNWIIITERKLFPRSTNYQGHEQNLFHQFNNRLYIEPAFTQRVVFDIISAGFNRSVVSCGQVWNQRTLVTEEHRVGMFGNYINSSF